MVIEVLPVEDKDMPEIFTLCSESFQLNEPAWTAMFPLHWTPAGRTAGAERFLQEMHSDPNAYNFKAVDTDTGAIVGFARWTVYQDRVPPETLEFPPYSYWPDDGEARFAEHLITQVMRRRRAHVLAKGGDVVHLDTLAVHPAHQRRGVGAKLMAWGVEKADALGFDAFLESSIYGRGLYKKFGFTIEDEVELDVPEEWAGRPTGSYAWMLRPKKVT